MTDDTITLQNATDSVVWKLAAAQSAELFEIQNSSDAVLVKGPWVTEVTTTDATVTSALEYTLDDESVITIEVTVTGRKSDGTDKAIGKYITGAFRTGAGVATLTGAVVVLLEHLGGAGDITIDVDGASAVRVRVTGVAAETWRWVSNATITRVD